MGNYYSYMRISTDTERQNFARQEKALKKYAEEALASAVFIGLFRFALGILPFRKLPLALFAVTIFPYLRNEEAGKGFYTVRIIRVAEAVSKAVR